MPAAPVKVEVKSLSAQADKDHYNFPMWILDIVCSFDVMKCRAPQNKTTELQF